MTRDELVDFTKSLLFEDSATSGLGTTAQFQTHIDIANKTIWQRAVKAAPSLFETRSADLTYSTATGYYDLSAMETNAGVYLPSRVFVRLSAYSSGRDPYFLLEPLDGDERHVAGRGEFASPGAPVAYYLEGERLYLAPRPSSNQTLQIVYVPNLPTMSGATQALGGKTVLTTYHPLVAYEAATVLAAKDEASTGEWRRLRDEMMKQMLAHLSRRQRQRPHSIREVPFA